MTIRNRRPVVHAEFADYDSATGGYVYNSRLRDELAKLGWTVTGLVLPDGFPLPSADARARIAGQFASLPDRAIVLIDQVCLGPIADLARLHAGRLAWVEIFHHPTVHDLVAFSSERDRIEANERAALAVADLVLVTSPATARAVISSYGVAAEKIVTAPPGFERFAARAMTRTSGAFRLLSVGALVPRKGYLALVEALADIRALDWSLNIVGNPDRDPGYVAYVVAMIARHGLHDRVRIKGRLSESALAAEWAAADLYVSASEHEGFGMAIGEAVMRGVPVVTTTAGAVGDWLSPACATIVAIGDVPRLRDAIAAVLQRPEALRAMRTAELAASEALPTWPGSALIVSEALAAAFP